VCDGARAARSRVQFQAIRDLQELNYWGHNGGDGSVLDSGPVTTPLWSPSIPVGRAFLSPAGADSDSRTVCAPSAQADQQNSQ